MVLGMFIPDLWSLDVKQGPRCLCIAKSNFPQTTFDNELLALGFCLGSLNGTLNLLFHSLHVVIATSSISAQSESAVCLKEIGLRELIRRLVRVLPCSTTDLTHHMVVKVFSNGCFRAPFFNVSSSSHELLELNTGDEVLVLGGHQAVVLGKQRYLVVALSTFRLGFDVGVTLFLRESHELLGMGDDHARERRTSVVPWWRAARPRVRSMRNGLSLSRKPIWVLENVSWLRRRALRLSLSMSRSLLLDRRFVKLSRPL